MDQGGRRIDEVFARQFTVFCPFDALISLYASRYLQATAGPSKRRESIVCRSCGPIDQPSSILCIVSPVAAHCSDGTKHRVLDKEMPRSGLFALQHVFEYFHHILGFSCDPLDRCSSGHNRL